jgi:hypothetical protein
MYYFSLSPYGDEKSFRDEDGRMIPTDLSNRDYQAYLAWVAEGNEATEWNPEETE